MEPRILKIPVFLSAFFLFLNGCSNTGVNTTPSIRVTNTDAWEPDDSVSQATLLDTSGTFQRHRISPPDTDWFKFEATGGRTYCIQTHGNADTYLWLYATNAFTILATNGNGGVGRNALVVWTCISSGIYFFKVTTPSRSLSADYSIDVRSGGAIIAITNPVSGTSDVQSGSTLPINWAFSTNAGTTVSLFAYRNDTVACLIAASAYNDGSFSWTIPWTLATSPSYRVKIVSDNDTSIHDVSDQFTITKIPCTLMITTPGKSTVWNAGSSYYLYWSSTGSTGNYVTINLYNDSTPVQAISSYASAGNGSYSWSIPSTLPGGARYRIKVASYTYPSIASYSDYFTIVQVPSRLTITTPSLSSSWYTGNNYQVSWTYAGAPGPSVRLDIYDSSMFVQTIFTSASTTAGSLSWLVPSSMHSSSRYQIKITSTTQDTVFNLSNFFTIVPAAPRLTITTPDATTSWTVGYSYSVYWSYSGSPGSNVKIELFDTTALVQAVSSNVYTSNGSLLWLVPTSLPSDNRYRIKITSTTMDTVYGFSNYFQIMNSSVGDSYEPDSSSTLAKPVIVGTTAQDHTLTSGDKDWLSFGATSGTSYTMETSGNLDTYMNLFSTDGATLISSDDDGGTGYNAKIIWTCTTTGTYYFEVIGISGSVGNYAVSVR